MKQLRESIFLSSSFAISFLSCYTHFLIIMWHSTLIKLEKISIKLNFNLTFVGTIKMKKRAGGKKSMKNLTCFCCRCCSLHNFTNKKVLIKNREVLSSFCCIHLMVATLEGREDQSVCRLISSIEGLCFIQRTVQFGTLERCLLSKRFKINKTL